MKIINHIIFKLLRITIKHMLYFTVKVIIHITDFHVQNHSHTNAYLKIENKPKVLNMHVFKHFLSPHKTSAKKFQIDDRK